MICDNQREEYIRKIRNEFNASQRVKDSLNNSIRALAQDLNNKDTHFILELIQNAEDNAYQVAEPSLSLKLLKTDPTNTNGTSGALIFQNNEVGFSAENVNAICAVGQTTKSKVQGYIGEKGIGFKSVFRVTSIPHILSNGYSFCLPEVDQETGLGFIVPKWIDIPPKGTDLNQTTIILPLDKEEFNYERIETMLREIEPETILFLSKLKELTIFTDTGDNITIYKVDSKAPLIEIRVEGTRQGESVSKVDKFLFYTKTFDKPPDITHEKRIGIDQRDVSIAFPLSEDKESAGKIFAYLPVRSEPCIPFLINADFILTSSREDIQEKELWNKWLAVCVAELIGESLEGLKKYHHLTVDFLEKLLKGILALKEKNLLFPIAGAIRKVLKTEDLLPAYNGTFIKVNEAKLARGKDLVELFSPEQLGFLFGKQELFWINPSITESGNYADIHTFLVGKKYQWFNSYEIEPLLEGLQVDADTLAPKLTADFLSSQPLPWLVKFIQYAEHGALALKRIPFIRLKCGKQVSLPINEKMPRPAWFAPADATGLDLSVFPIVHPEISDNEDIRKFLEKEGIREIDAIAIVEKSILPKYQEPNLYFDESSYTTDLNQIRTAYVKANDKEKSQLTTILNNYQWIATVHASGKEPNKMKWEKPGSSAVFEKTTDNEIWFEGLENVIAYFLHSSVIETLNDLTTILSRVSVKLTENLIENENTNTFRDQKESHYQGLKGFNPDATIIGIDSAWTNWNKERAMILWKILLTAPNKIISGETQFSTNRQYLDRSAKEIEYTDVGELCSEDAWLFDKNGDLHKSNELLLNDLPEGYETTSIAAKELAVKLGMKQPELEQALKTITGGNNELKKLFDYILQASDEERKKMLQTIPREIPPQPVPSFKVGLKSLGRPQRGIINDYNIGSTPVKNPVPYQVKLNEKVGAEVDEQKNLPQTITFSLIRDHPSNADARKFLYEYYRGCCQITGSTFPKATPSRDGVAENYFEACSLLSYANADYLNDAGNMLCVSADTMAKLKNASIEFIEDIADAIEKFKENGSLSESVSVKIRLAGEECTITWSQRHFMRLVALYEIA